jgi:hypothetical protein
MYFNGLDLQGVIGNIVGEERVACSGKLKYSYKKMFICSGL